MPEGLTNSPTLFQRFINDIFVDMIDVIVIIYLDDILIYSDNISEHKAHVQEVLHRLCTNGIFAHADKCEFHATSCEYLGYMLSLDNPSLVLPTFTNISFTDIPKSLFHLHAS